MTKRDKLRRKLKNNPKGVKYTELETLLHAFGFELIRVKGSHHIFRYTLDEVSQNLIVPVHSNHVKSNYVADSMKIIDKLFPEIEQQDRVEDSEDEQDN